MEKIENGIELRDWFAGCALPAVLSRCQLKPWLPGVDISCEYPDNKELAKFCYSISDAMLKERGCCKYCDGTGEDDGIDCVFCGGDGKFQEEDSENGK